MSQLSLKGVYKAYYSDRRMTEARVVLNDIDIDIEEGEFVSIIGPSGCGKTTVLNLLAGFERPTKGSVTYNGKEISGPSPERGIVFQEYSLFPWMSVQKNIELALECNNVPEKLRADMALDALKKVGMGCSADSRPNTLSGGMKQRVAIARLLAMDSDVFLMDEPFSALDEQTRHKLDEDIVNLWEEKKKTVVFVTHSVEEAIMVSTRIIMLSNSPGRIIGEWDLSNRGSKDPSLPENARLKKEIMDRMPLCNCALCR